MRENFFFLSKRFDGNAASAIIKEICRGVIYFFSSALRRRYDGDDALYEEIDFPGKV